MPVTPADVGAEVELARRAPAATATAVPAATAPPDPAAEAMLAALQLRVAEAPPPRRDSIVATLLRREGKRRRAEQAVAKGIAEPVAAVPAAPPSAAPAVAPFAAPVTDEVAAELAAREQEPWFQRLPASEQQRLRTVWHDEAHRFDGMPEAQRQARVETFWVAYVVFFFAGIPLLIAEGLGVFCSMALAGCVAGVAWQFVPRDRFACSASAVGIYALVVLAPRAQQLLLAPFSAGVLLFGMVLVAWLAAMAAMTGEMRRAGGFQRDVL